MDAGRNFFCDTYTDIDDPFEVDADSFVELSFLD